MVDHFWVRGSSQNRFHHLFVVQTGTVLDCRLLEASSLHERWIVAMMVLGWGCRMSRDCCSPLHHWQLPGFCSGRKALDIVVSQPQFGRITFYSTMRRGNGNSRLCADVRGRLMELLRQGPGTPGKWHLRPLKRWPQALHLGDPITIGRCCWPCCGISLVNSGCGCISFC